MEKKVKQLRKLKKAELIEYIVLMSLASETRPFSIMTPSIKTKTKHVIVIDRKSSRYQIYSKLFRFVLSIIRNAK